MALFNSTDFFSSVYTYFQINNLPIALIYCQINAPCYPPLSETIVPL